MTRLTRVLLIGALLLVTAHRLPAPIQEIPENPTPAPEPTASSQPKSAPKSKPKSETTRHDTSAAKPQPTVKQSRFAGTWSGTMPEVPWGDVPTDLTVNQSETTMDWRETGKSKGSTAKTTVSGDTISARFPAGFTTAVWYITPRPDGVTADVRLTAFMNDQKAVFQRKTTSQPSAVAAPIKPAKPETSTTELPTAKPVPGKPGFVYNPFNPKDTRLLDCRSKAPGTKAKDPFSGKLFIVP